MLCTATSPRRNSAAASWAVRQQQRMKPSWRLALRNLNSAAISAGTHIANVFKPQDPDCLGRESSVEQSDPRLVNERQFPLGPRIEKHRPTLALPAVRIDNPRIVPKGVEVVHGREHRDVTRFLRSQEMIRLNIELVHRNVADASVRVFVDAAQLGQWADIVPAIQPCGVDGLQRTPVPNNRQIVKALIVDVVGLGIERRLALATDKVEHLEFDVETKICRRSQPNRLQQRNVGAEDT